MKRRARETIRKSSDLAGLIAGGQTKIDWQRHTIMDFFHIGFLHIFKEPVQRTRRFFLQKTLHSEGHKALIKIIIEKRKAAGLKQEDVAKALGQRQPWIAHLESEERRIDVIEYVRLADAIGFNAVEELRKLIPIILKND